MSAADCCCLVMEFSPGFFKVRIMYGLSPDSELNYPDFLSKEPSDLGDQTREPENKPKQSGETLRGTVQNLKAKSNGEMLDDDWEMFECDKCDKKYNHRSGLYNHTKAVHEGIKFQCNHCNYTSNQKYKVKIHGQRLHGNQAQTLTMHHSV